MKSNGHITTLRLPKTMNDQIVLQAMNLGVSKNSYILMLISAALKNDDNKPRKKEPS